MSQVENRNPERFQINPIELAVTAAIGGVFLYSLMQLIYSDSTAATSSALVAMKARPTSEGRHPLSAANSPLLTLAVECKPAMESSTTASKVRLQGDLCGVKSPDEGIRLNTATIINTSNQFSATVFAQNDSNHFSTDFIPLAPGANKIHLEFSYSGGIRPFSQDVVITRN